MNDAGFVGLGWFGKRASLAENVKFYQDIEER